jgi:hypothetical protein
LVRFPPLPVVKISAATVRRLLTAGEKTVSTLEKTKVLTVFSKVRIVFPKVLSVFRGAVCGGLCRMSAKCRRGAVKFFRQTGPLCRAGAKQILFCKERHSICKLLSK